MIEWLYRTPIEAWKNQDWSHDNGYVSFNQVKEEKGYQLWEIRITSSQSNERGAWTIQIDELGNFCEVKILLVPPQKQSTDHQLVQQGTWISFKPSKTSSRSRMNFFLSGRLVTTGKELPYPLFELPKIDERTIFEHIQEVHLASFLPSHRWIDKRNEDFYLQVKDRLSTIPTVWDCLWLPQNQGTWVRFENLKEETTWGLGPWGTVLWVGEAILKGWGGHAPTLAALTKPRSRMVGYSQALVLNGFKDPLFSLNWNRNIGLALQQILYPHRPLTHESADVSDLPFFENLNDYGYPVSDLKAIIHLLATIRPGRIYLATMNTQEQDPKGKALSVNYLEPAVLIPWVGKDDVVRAVLFSGPQEISIENWLDKAKKRTRSVRPGYVQITELLLPKFSLFTPFYRDHSLLESKTLSH